MGGDTQAPGSDTTDTKTLLDTIMEKVLDPRGNFTTYDKIVDDIEAYFKKTGSDAKKEAGQMFHGIGSSGTVDLDDAAYWGDKVKTSLNFMPIIYDNTPVSVFVTRSPYVNPCRRGTSDIDFFLNYTPPVFASQMVPYLDVEFELNRVPSPGKGSLTTPSLLRFLLGSVEVSSLSDADKAYDNTINPDNSDKSSSTARSFSGMEMFLAPQTLTNMDTLGESVSRLVRVKPFLPFASIENFEVSVQNAGAGNFAHKTGNLRLKIHDKARLAEISEFIRGSSGYNQASVWTTYGWLAPRGRGDEDAYAKFVNESMLVRECWKVVNPSFTFDGAGQVSLVLSMVSKGIEQIQKTSITAGNKFSSTLNGFHQAIQAIAEIKDKLPGEADSFNVEVRASQVLNAASTTGIFTDIKDIGPTINNIVAGLNKSGKVATADIEELQKNLEKLKAGDHSYDGLKNSAAAAAQEKFNSCSDGEDPFLPDSSKKDYFKDTSITDVISQFNKSSKKRIEIIKNSKKTTKIIKNSKKTTKININQKVVSFGKLFTTFVVPAVLSIRPKVCDELQVVFYTLNDTCGPISNHSVAEFPIDMSALAYAYADAIKTGSSDSMTIEQFLSLVINSQFSDQRAIGYGMNSFFEPFNPDNTAAKQSDSKDAVNGMSAWMGQYGALNMPIIEMYVESSEQRSSSVDLLSSIKQSNSRLKNVPNDPDSKEAKTIIKRIHVYDKRCNPYKMMTQIVNDGEEFSIGKFNGGKLRDYLAKHGILEKIDQSNLASIRRKLEDGVPFAQALHDAVDSFINVDEVNKLELVDRPAGNVVKIGKNRKSIRDSLSRYVPNIKVGTNGTMVITANMASKVDGTMGAINIINSNKAQATGGVSAVSTNGLEGPGGLPVRVVPAQMTMTTMGVPIAQLYQQFFVDFNTGTTLDNLYNCTQLQHSMSPGKFTTNWTFAYINGYVKFSAQPTLTALATGELKNILDEALKANPKK